MATLYLTKIWYLKRYKMNYLYGLILTFLVTPQKYFYLKALKGKFL